MNRQWEKDEGFIHIYAWLIHEKNLELAASGDFVADPRSSQNLNDPDDGLFDCDEKTDC